MKFDQEFFRKIIDRGIVSEILPSEKHFIEILRKQKTPHIYLGIDPTAKLLHLGHLQQIMFLEDLRKLGCKITLLFGDFTATVGDPSDQNKKRKILTNKNIEDNLSHWKKQVKNSIDLSFFSKAGIRRNSEWLEKLTAKDLINLMSLITTQNLLERDMFKKRMKDGDALYSNEIIYPILQGYDSVAMEVDGELSGTDQTFNALVGRDFVKKFLKKEKVVITTKLIEADGVLMSKSNGTGVFIDIDEGGENRMFGQIMSLSDGFIYPVARGCTRIPVDILNKMKNVESKEARDYKLMVAFEIVKQIHGEKKASQAKESFITQFSNKETPTNVKKIVFIEGESIIETLSKATDLSNSEIKRKIKENAVSIDNKKIQDINYKIQKKDKSKAIKIGRHLFLLD